MLMLIRAIFVMVAVAAGAAFASTNFQAITVNVLFTTVEAPLVLFIACAFIIGLLLGLLASGIRILRLREQLRRSRRNNTAQAVTDKPRTTAPKLR